MDERQCTIETFNGMLKEFTQCLEEDYQNKLNKVPDKEINLYVLVDSGGYICYTSSQEDLVKNYKESNCFTNKTIVKLTGFLPAGEK